MDPITMQVAQMLAKESPLAAMPMPDENGWFDGFGCGLLWRLDARSGERGLEHLENRLHLVALAGSHNDLAASATEVLQLIAQIQETAKAKRGIELETEVQIVGEEA